MLTARAAEELVRKTLSPEDQERLVRENLEKIEGISKKYDVRIGTFGHAGDGNFHVSMMIRDTAEDREKAERAVEELFAETIRLGGTLSEEQREYLGIIMEKGESLLHLITSILDISKIEAGRVRLVLGDVDVAQLLRDAAATVRAAAVSILRGGYRDLELIAVDDGSSDATLPLRVFTTSGIWDMMVETSFVILLAPAAPPSPPSPARPVCHRRPARLAPAERRQTREPGR